jgi:hypothetical protein
MRIEFDVELMERDGLPQARVSRNKAWDLVDYLAQQRVHVTYSFESERLLVNFHHMTMDAARHLINTWQHATEREAVQHAALPKHDQWLVGTRYSA